MGRTISSKGFTILEITFTVFILAIGILFLSAAIGSSQRLTTLARERIVADNAVQAYIERMRQYYPDDNANPSEMKNLLLDSRTPSDFLPTSGLESKLLKNVQSYVVRTTFEKASTWNSSANTSGITPPTAPTIEDLFAIGMATGSETVASHTGRDLDGDGAISTDTVTPATTSKVLFIPALMYIEWLSGSGAIDKNTQKQSIKVYAVFGPQH